MFDVEATLRLPPSVKELTAKNIKNHLDLSRCTELEIINLSPTIWHVELSLPESRRSILKTQLEKLKAGGAATFKWK